jgi:hypothetical protein
MLAASVQKGTAGRLTGRQPTLRSMVAYERRPLSTPALPREARPIRTSTRMTVATANRFLTSSSVAPSFWRAMSYARLKDRPDRHSQTLWWIRGFDGTHGPVHCYTRKRFLVTNLRHPLLPLHSVPESPFSWETHNPWLEQGLLHAFALLLILPKALHHLSQFMAIPPFGWLLGCTISSTCSCALRLPLDSCSSSLAAIVSAVPRRDAAPTSRPRLLWFAASVILGYLRGIWKGSSRGEFLGAHVGLDDS